MSEHKNFWDRNAGRYDRFMRKDRAAYEEMYALLRPVVKAKTVLELATGTGLIAKNIVNAAAHIEATDASVEMILEAKRDNRSAKLHFSVQDMFHLPYADKSFDVVIVSNALHIVPQPEKALQEIRWVLKDGGLLIAPTFTHAENSFSGKVWAFFMKLAGLPLHSRWTSEEYLRFLRQNGWTVRKSAVLKASFPLTDAGVRQRRCDMSFFENTRKPVGFGGKLMVAMMNLGHSPVARWGLQFLELAPDARVLDCGCGGGANIRRLLKKCPQGIVKGIDYSSVSVEKAQRLNRSAIQEGRCAVLQGSVADMMFADNWFDAVTAFETVYFWPDLPRCFREVYRVLKVGGTFLICNESNGDTDRDEKWTKLIGGMTIYKDTELKVYLEQTGFHEVQIHKKKSRLCVAARK